MYLLANGNGGIQAVVNAIKNLIQFIKVILQFIGNLISSIVVALNILAQLIPKIFIWIATLPNWILVFAEITIGVSVAYFIIDRKTGKSE